MLFEHKLCEYVAHLENTVLATDWSWAWTSAWCAFSSWLSNSAKEKDFMWAFEKHLKAHQEHSEQIFTN